MKVTYFAPNGLVLPAFTYPFLRFSEVHFPTPCLFKTFIKILKKFQPPRLFVPPPRLFLPPHFLGTSYRKYRSANQTT